MSYLCKYSNKSSISNKVNVLIRLFHNSSIYEAGRKTGSNAFDTSPRDFSKKQKQRFKVKLEFKNLNYEKKIKKIKEKQVSHSMDSKKLNRLVEDTQSSLVGALDELMMPDAFQDNLVGSNKKSHDESYKNKDLLAYLKNNCQMSFKLLEEVRARDTLLFSPNKKVNTKPEVNSLLTIIDGKIVISEDVYAPALQAFVKSKRYLLIDFVMMC